MGRAIRKARRAARSTLRPVGSRYRNSLVPVPLQSKWCCLGCLDDELSEGLSYSPVGIHKADHGKIYSEEHYGGGNNILCFSYKGPGNTVYIYDVLHHHGFRVVWSSVNPEDWDDEFAPALTKEVRAIAYRKGWIR